MEQLKKVRLEFWKNVSKTLDVDVLEDECTWQIKGEDIKVDVRSMDDEYVAAESVTISRYLILIETKLWT